MRKKIFTQYNYDYDKKELTPSPTSYAFIEMGEVVSVEPQWITSPSGTSFYLGMRSAPVFRLEINVYFYRPLTTIPELTFEEREEISSKLLKSIETDLLACMSPADTRWTMRKCIDIRNGLDGQKDKEYYFHCFQPSNGTVVMAVIEAQDGNVIVVDAEYIRFIN